MKIGIKWILIVIIITIIVNLVSCRSCDNKFIKLLGSETIVGGSSGGSGIILTNVLFILILQGFIIGIMECYLMEIILMEIITI